MLDPGPWYQEMRRTAPVYYDPHFSFFFGAVGGWQLFRYDDVKRAFIDYETFSSAYLPPTGDDILADSLMTSDPPRHRNLRSLVNKAFSPATVARLEPWLYKTCEILIRSKMTEGEMDFVQHIATPLPNLVLARLLGIPGMQAHQVSCWTKAITGDPTVMGMEVYKQHMDEMVAFLMELLEDRRAAPKQDLISDLLAAEIEGVRLTTREVIAFCITILGAGTETTEAWLMIAMQLLMEYPDLQQHLSIHPEDIPGALQEILRFRTPIMGLPRIAAKDVEIGGQQIRKGEFVNLVIAAANRDPAVFNRPDELDITRDTGKQLGFGYGIHYCIGSMLAKIEGRIVFETLLRLGRNYRLPAGTSIERHPSTFVYSFPSLPLQFEGR